MARILGGNASRLEVYALFAAAVVLIGGGVAGAVVVTSSDSKPAEVAQVSPGSSNVTASTSQEAAATSPTATSELNRQNGAGSTSPTITVPGLTAEQAETLRQQIQRQQDAEAAAAQAAAYAAMHPVARVQDILYATCLGSPQSLLRWTYLGEYPARNEIQVTIKWNGRSSTGSPNAFSGNGPQKASGLGSEMAPAPGAPVAYEITTTGPEGPIRGMITPTVVECSVLLESQYN
jgi:hypothetical protein